MTRHEMQAIKATHVRFRKLNSLIDRRLQGFFMMVDMIGIVLLGIDLVDAACPLGIGHVGGHYRSAEVID